MTNNHQSGSDFRILGTSTIIRDDVDLSACSWPTMTLIQWDPITQASDGADLRTDSLFVNDAWRFSNGVSLNLGLRWDHNNATDGAGNAHLEFQPLQPTARRDVGPVKRRPLGVHRQLRPICEQPEQPVADVSPAGRESTYQFAYQGPSINADPNGRCRLAAAIEQAFDWFNANGGTSYRRPPLPCRD